MANGKNTPKSKPVPVPKAVEPPATVNPVAERLEAYKAAVASGDMDIAPLREVFMAEHKRETTLKDNGVLAALASVVDDDGDYEPDELAAAMLEAEDTATEDGEGEPDPSQGEVIEDDDTPSIKTVARFAAEVAQGFSKETIADLQKIADAGETVRLSAITVYHDLKRDFKVAMNEWPIPGTTSKDVEGTNRRADIYYKRVFSGANKKPKKMTFYGDLYASLPIGIANQDQRDKLKAVSDQTVGYDTKLAMVPKPTRSGRKRAIDSRYNSQKNVVAKAASIHFQTMAVDDLPDLEWSFCKEEDGKLIPSTKPILIWPRGKSDLFAEFSVGSFLAIDFAKVKAKGGTMKAVHDVLAAGADPSAAEPAIKTGVQLEGALLELDAAFTGPNQKSLERAFSEMTTAKGKDADTMCLVVERLYKVLDSNYMHIETRCRHIRQARANKVKPANAA
jgi:hypothetical protein